MARLNARELSMMDSPLRRFSQRVVELQAFQRLLRRAQIDLRGGDLLDAGCGNGYGLELLARAFRPRRLVGFDVMPEQVQRAKHRGLAAEISLGDITAIAQPEASFDGVFVFGILHHVPAWRTALGELARVMRPGGVLLIEELHGAAVRLEDRVLGTSHPPDAAFNWFELRGALATAGLAITAETGLLCGAMRSFAAVKPRGNA